MAGWIEREMNWGFYRVKENNLVPNPENEFRACRMFSDYRTMLVVLPGSWKFFQLS